MPWNTPAVPADPKIARPVTPAPSPGWFSSWAGVRPASNSTKFNNLAPGEGLARKPSLTKRTLVGGY